MTVRMAIIGCGAITGDLHLPAARQVPEVKITTLVDTDIAQAQRLASEFGVDNVATDLNQCPNLDAIILATPPSVRVPIIRQAVKLGLHVLIEKPLANTVAECHEIQSIVQTAKCVVATAHVYRFWPSRNRIRQAILSDEFGTIRHIEMSQGKPYSWKSVTGYTMLRDQVPGGVLINAGIHPLDTLLWWLGDPVRISYLDDAIGGLESNCVLDLVFPDEVTARLRMSRTSSLKHFIRISTNRAEIVLPTYSRDRFEVTIDGSTSTVLCGETDDHLMPACEQLRDFANAVSQGLSPRVTVDEGTRVIRVVEQCYQTKRARPLTKTAPIPGAVW